MFSLETMRTAKEWIIVEIETGRCMIPMPHDLAIVKSWNDKVLNDFADQALDWNFSRPVLLDVPKGNQAFRKGHYIPPQDRLILCAAMVHHYDHIHNYVTSDENQVNYDRPLPINAEENFIRVDYHDHYMAFKNRLIADEEDNKWILHTDIKNFAGSCCTDKTLESLNELGFEETTLSIFYNAFNIWKADAVTGIPQGYALTDILLKVYMVSIDDMMTQRFGNEVSYYRYCDDIQIAGQKDQVQAAGKYLQSCLNEKGLILKEQGSILAEPGVRAIGHAYQPHKILEQLVPLGKKQELIPSDYEFDRDNPHACLVLSCYEHFVSPRKINDEMPNKYLFSYVLRHMRKQKLIKFVPDVPDLIDMYPNRLEKLLRSALAVGMPGQHLAILVPKFFTDEGRNNPKKDHDRLVFLNILKENFYPVEPISVQFLNGALDSIVTRNPLFKPHKQELQKMSDAYKISTPKSGRQSECFYPTAHRPMMH